MERPFFSIVMPSYQVEEYIHQAVKSALQQTFENFELIIVDDGSDDQSGRIADEYDKLDSRVHAVHHERNKGVSAARNTGLDMAVGRYILFWDPDDEVDCWALEAIYKSIMQNAAQIVVYGLIEEYFDRTKRLIHTNCICPNHVILNNHSDLRKAIIGLETMTLYGYPWNKCYDLEYLRTQCLKFRDVRMIEDIQFNIEFCQNIERMNILDITPYHYKKRVNNSLTRKFDTDYYFLHRERIRLLFEQYQSWKICTDEVKRELGNRFVRYIYSALERNCDKRSQFSFADKKAWLEQVYVDDMFTQLVPYAVSNKFILNIMNNMLQRHSTLLCLMCARCIYIIKNKLPIAFIWLQQKR